MARPVTVTLSHDLGVEEARKRIRDSFGKLKSAMTGGMIFKFEETWESDDKLTFTARGLGQTITGVIDVFPQHVRIEAVLPGLLASLAETVTGKLEKEATILLEKK
ncbi:MAG: polyhydroxyalkanoic acid system family protein [Parvularculaceae bacterium]|nr:polyhydroxyalkanoic acid system family protein [Parvularculaceae bacterium]